MIRRAIIFPLDCLNTWGNDVTKNGHEMGQEGQPECRMHQQRIQGMLHGIAASQFVTGNVPKSVPEPSTQLTALKGSRDVSYKVEHLPSKHGILNSNSGT